MTARRHTHLLPRRSILSVAFAAGMFSALPAAHADGAGRLVDSATLNAAGSVILPPHEGTSQGRAVWYVLLDVSDSKDAASLGINQASKLANTRGTRATQKVRVINGLVDFPVAVDFTPEHLVVAGPSAPFPLCQ
ncbi:MAG: hypothetical protein RLZZ584_1470 [Pseudomonadota bacterium]|jgi:hypothetical protein